VHPATVDRRAFVSVNVGDLHLMLDADQAKRLAEVALQAAKEAGA